MHKIHSHFNKSTIPQPGAQFHKSSTLHSCNCGDQFLTESNWQLTLFAKCDARKSIDCTRMSPADSYVTALKLDQCEMRRNASNNHFSLALAFTAYSRTRLARSRFQLKKKLAFVDAHLQRQPTRMARHLTDNGEMLVINRLCYQREWEQKRVPFERDNSIRRVARWMLLLLSFNQFIHRTHCKDRSTASIEHKLTYTRRSTPLLAASHFISFAYQVNKSYLFIASVFRSFFFSCGGVILSLGSGIFAVCDFSCPYRLESGRNRWWYCSFAMHRHSASAEYSLRSRFDQLSLCETKRNGKKFKSD